MTEPEKDPLDKLSDWLTGWKASFEQLRQRFGTLVAISLVFLGALSLVWWNWDELKKRPGVEWIVAHVIHRTFPFSAEQRLADKKFAEGERARLGDQNDAARAAYGEALTLFKQVDDRLGQANVQRGLGDLESTLGRTDAARAAYDEALTLYKQADNRLGQANVQRGLGDLERGLGRKDAARAAYAVAAELFGEVGLTEWQEAALTELRKLDGRSHHR